MNRWIARFGFWFPLTTVLACAEQRPPINRVQANALAKDFFVGDPADPADDPVFLSRNFVVDASLSQELVGISSSSGVERMRWDITENMLFARRAYSLTDGDNKGNGIEPNGDIIAAYRIDSHFDVRRAYSPSTGEELNIVEENTSDRPWHEREYFRVDWSENLVESPVWTTMFFGQTFGRIEITPISYYESDADSDDAPHFEPEQGYFDITSHFNVEPETMELWGLDVPICFLMGIFTGSAIYSCDSQEAVVRSSYWRLDQADPDDDFEPFENTGAPLDIFGNPGGIGNSATLGIVTPPRETYDPGYGFTDEGLRRYMNVLDLWRQSHQTIGSCETNDECEQLTGRRGAQCLDSGTCSVPCNYEARGDTNGNGTDDQCENEDTDYEGREGAQCSARNRCTIPYRDREVAPVAYFMNPEMPADLQDEVDSGGDPVSRGASEDLLHTWNQALQVTVARAREVECRRAGTGNAEEVRRQCHERYFEVNGSQDRVQMVSYGGWGIETPLDDTDVLVACHNPVRSYDPAVCGEEGERARVGDLRRNFLIYWPYNTQAPYGGIGNWRGDPLTGQIIGAAATTIGRSTTQSAAQVRDLALVALGELDFTDITNGVPAARFQQELRDGRRPTALTLEELDARVRRVIERSSGAVSANAAEVELPSAGLNEILETRLPQRTVLDLKGQLLASPELAAKAYLETRAAAEPLLGSSLEVELVSGDWLVDTLGYSPSTPVTDDVLERASMLRGQDLALLTYLSGEVSRSLGLKGVCHFDSHAPIGNPDISGIGHYYREKYPNLSGTELAEAIYEDLWIEAYKGIQLHEIGHSLGLLHNFASSYDALNYNPQYWQLRSHEGDSTRSCEGLPRSGNLTSTGNDTCMGPRYLDPETDDELGQGDEPRPGLSYYAHTSTMEYQAARFFESVGLGQYDLMAVGALYGRVLQTFDAQEVSADAQYDFEPLLQTQLSDDWFTNSGLVHYTELARRAGIISNLRCRDATNEEKERAEWRIVHDRVCAPPRKDYGHWDDFVDQSDPTVEDVTVARKLRVGDTSRPAGGNVRWPYRFGGDIANSYPHVNPFDSGADLYELTRETVAKNDYEYPLRYFRRDRRGWDDGGLPARTAFAFYERLRSYHWSASFTKTAYDAFYDELRANFRTPDDIAAIEQFRAEAFADDNALRPALLAQAEMFQGIASTLLKPEPGDYAVLPSSAGIADVAPSWAAGNPLFTVDASDARFMAPDFDSGPSGGGAWEYQTYVDRGGYRFEKALASRALTDGRPVLFTIGRETYLDSRNVNINFRANMPDAVDRLLAGVLAEDWEAIGPYVVSPNGTASAAEVRYRDFSADASITLPAGAQTLFPNVGYNQQVPTMIFAQLFGRINGDLSLTNKMRVWLDGSVSGELTVPEAEQIRFTDPESGITYIARLFGSESFYGNTNDRGIGSRMVERANELMTQVFVAAADDEGEPVVDEFGRPALETTEDGQLVRIEDDPEAYTRFREYVGLLDAAVQISTFFGHGPL